MVRKDILSSIKNLIDHIVALKIEGFTFLFQSTHHMQQCIGFFYSFLRIFFVLQHIQANSLLIIKLDGSKTLHKTRFAKMC